MRLLLLDPETRQTRPLVRAPAGAIEADTAWTSDGLLLVPCQGQLFGWRRNEAEMRPVCRSDTVRQVYAQ